jgi:hypothetical protein
MNDIDIEVREAMTRLIRGQLIEIDLAERRLLATWATKTAIVLEQTRGLSDLTRRRGLAPPQAARELFATRSPPKPCWIWIGQVAPYEAGARWMSVPIPLIRVDPEATTSYGAPYALLHTLLIGAVIIQILLAPKTKIFEETAAQRTREGSDWMRLLWPETARFDWPPEKFLAREAVWYFAR